MASDWRIDYDPTDWPLPWLPREGAMWPPSWDHILGRPTGDLHADLDRIAATFEWSVDLRAVAHMALDQPGEIVVLGELAALYDEHWPPRAARWTRTSALDRLQKA